MIVVSFVDTMQGLSNYWFPDLLVDMKSSRASPEGGCYGVIHLTRVDGAEDTGILSISNFVQH